MMATREVRRFTPVIVLTLMVCWSTIEGHAADDNVVNIETPGQQPRPENVGGKIPRERCNRLPVFPAQCRPDVPGPSARSWFYDAVSATCRQLPFIRCSLMGESENSFTSWEECRDICLNQRGMGAVTITTVGDDVTSTVTSQLATGATTRIDMTTTAYSDDVITDREVAADFIERSDGYTTVSQITTTDSAAEDNGFEDNERTSTIETIDSTTQNIVIERSVSSSNVKTFDTAIEENKLGDHTSQSLIESIHLTLEDNEPRDNESASNTEKIDRNTEGDQLSDTDSSWHIIIDSSHASDELRDNANTSNIETIESMKNNNKTTNNGSSSNGENIHSSINDNDSSSSTEEDNTEITDDELAIMTDQQSIIPEAIIVEEHYNSPGSDVVTLNVTDAMAVDKDAEIIYQIPSQMKTGTTNAMSSRETTSPDELSADVDTLVIDFHFPLPTTRSMTTPPSGDVSQEVDEIDAPRSSSNSNDESMRSTLLASTEHMIDLKKAQSQLESEKDVTMTRGDETLNNDEDVQPTRNDVTSRGKRKGNMLEIIQMFVLDDGITDVVDDAKHDKQDDQSSEQVKETWRESRRPTPPQIHSYKFAKLSLDGNHQSPGDSSFSMTSSKRPKLCLLPVVFGYCFDRKQRWYYDVISGSCRSFYYTGCGGNMNNFDDVNDCMRTCSRPTCNKVPPSAAVPSIDGRVTPGGGIMEVGSPQKAMHTLTIMMPVQLNEGKVDQVFEDDSFPKFIDRNTNARSDVMNRGEGQYQQQPYHNDVTNRLESQFQQQQPINLDSWNLPPVSSRFFIPALMAAQMSRGIANSVTRDPSIVSPFDQHKVKISEPKKPKQERPPQTQQWRQQTISRRPNAVVKNDVMMTSVSYGLVGPQPGRMIPHSGFPIMDKMEFPINKPITYLPDSRYQSEREYRDERAPIDWRQRQSSGKSRKRGSLREEEPQHRIRDETRLERPRERPADFVNRSERPRVKKPLKSKSTKSKSRKSHQSKKIQRKPSWRQEEELRGRFSQNEERRPSWSQEDELRGRFSQNEEGRGIFPVNSRLPVDDKMTLFQVVVRRQQDIAHHRFTQPMPFIPFSPNSVDSALPRDDINQYGVETARPRDEQQPPFFMPKETFFPQQTPDSDNSLTSPMIIVTSDVSDDFMQPSYVCFLPRDIGNCKSYQNKWFFNVNNGQCEMFFYGGCGGNTNRFDDLDTCRHTCTPNDFKPSNQKDDQGQTTSDVTQSTKQMADSKETETTTSVPSDVIYVTSPVYVPMTREDSDAETETESTLNDVTRSTKSEDHSQPTTTESGVLEMTTELEHRVIASHVIDQSAITGLSTQYIAIVSVLGAVGLAVIILVIISVAHMCRKVHKSKKEAAVEEVIKTHMYGDLPQVVYSQATAISNKYDEKL